ncbi:hypothetical protein OROHE_022383 [Orobanche hederae]
MKQNSAEKIRRTKKKPATMEPARDPRARYDTYNDMSRTSGSEAFERLFKEEMNFMVPPSYLNDEVRRALRRTAVEIIEEQSSTGKFDALIPSTAMTYFDRYFSKFNRFPTVTPPPGGRDEHLFAICCLTLAWKLRNKSFALPVFLHESARLFAICCLTIAWKLHNKSFDLSSFLRERNISYSKEDVLQMELQICRGLEWRMRTLTPFCFVEFFTPILDLQPNQLSPRNLVYDLIARSQRAGAGLKNIHSICYMNSVLQCFVHCGIFYEKIFSPDHYLICQCENGQNYFCLLHSIRDLFEDLTSGSEVVAADWLCQNLDYFDKTFRYNVEDEASKFLQCFLRKLRSNHDASPSKIPLEQRLFGGNLSCKVKCCKCHAKSSPDQRFSEIEVDFRIYENQLEQVLRRIMCDINEKCLFCKTMNSCKATVDCEPKVAIFILTDCNKKARRWLSFPMKLDLTPYAKYRSHYDLTAVLIHVQDRNWGHFYTYARVYHNIWYKFDDENVTQVTEEEVMGSNAYILFYERKPCVWFSRAVREHQ